MIPTNRPAIEYMLRLVNGQLATYTDRTPADSNNKFQQGSLDACKALVREEHAKPKGHRFSRLIERSADGSMTDKPLPDDWPRAPHDLGEVLEMLSNDEQAAWAPVCMPSALVQIVQREAVTPTPDDFADLPEQMVQARRWLVRKGKNGKQPFYANGKPRSGVLDSPEDVAQLVTFGEVFSALQTGHYDGIGFALGPDGTGNHWQGIDLDDVPSRPEIQHLADNLPGYTEMSPSGKGVHAIGYGKPFAALGSNGTGIEAYSSGRYFTMTGAGGGLHDPCDLTSFVVSHLQPAHSRGKPAELATEAEHVETVDPKTVTELRSALLSIPSDARDLWIRMGHALKPLGNVGRGLWLVWSSTSDKFDVADAARVWRSLKPNNTGYQAVFAEASRHGWINPLTNESTGGARRDEQGASKNSSQSAQKNAADDAPALTIEEVKVWRRERALVPAHLQTFPTKLLNQYLAWFNRCAESTVNTLSLVGVIHLAHVVVARAAKTDKNNYASGYFISMAPTGQGKNYPKNAAAHLLREAGIHYKVYGEFHSKGGVYSALLSSPTVVFHLDEFGDRIKQGLREGSQVSGAFSYIKEVYSICGSILPAPSYSTMGMSSKQIDAVRAISYPCPNFNCLTTPGQFFDAIDNQSVEGGFINRFVGVISQELAIKNDDPLFNPPNHLIEHVALVRTHLAGVGNLGNEKFSNSDLDPYAMVYPFDDESRRLLDEFRQEITREYSNDEFMASMSVRWRENAMRMALALAVFSTPTVRKIDAIVTRWCIDFVRFHGKQFASAVLEHAKPKSPYGLIRRDFLAAFRSNPQGTQPTELGKKAPWRNVKARDRKEIIDDLIAHGLLAEVLRHRDGQRGPQGRVYVALSEK